MIFNFQRFQIVVRRPYCLLLQIHTELVFQYTSSNRLLPVNLPKSYQVRTYNETDNLEILNVLYTCGFSFSTRQLEEALHFCIPQGIHLIESCVDHAIVSLMMSRHISNQEFPFGGRIDWLATSPTHRSRGLGRASIALATNHLINSGYKNIWVTTQPRRLNAIKLFTLSGYSPTPNNLCIA